MLIELPAGLFLRKFPPRYVIGFALISFGVIACCFAVAKTYATAIVLRLLIGLGEAFVNNAFIYISTWYKPDELALRTGAYDCP
jgi:MFS family permease